MVGCGPNSAAMPVIASRTTAWPLDDSGSLLDSFWVTARYRYTGSLRGRSVTLLTAAIAPIQPPQNALPGRMGVAKEHTHVFVAAD